MRWRSSTASPASPRPARLMLPSAPERPTTLNLLAETAIVVLRADRVVGAYEEAWDLLRERNCRGCRAT